MAITIIKSGDDDTGLLEYCSVAGPGTPVVSLDTDRGAKWDRTGSAKWVSYGATGQRGVRPVPTGSLARRLERPVAHFFRKVSFPSKPTLAVLRVWSTGGVSVFVDSKPVCTAPNDIPNCLRNEPGLLSGEVPCVVEIMDFPQEGWLRFDPFHLDNVPFGLRWTLEVTHP